MAYYKLTPERVGEMLEAQGGACAVCREPFGKWEVDHDHTCCPGRESCGECVRSLLCFRCNNGLGCFGDDVSKIRRAAAYLEERQWQMDMAA